MTSLPGNGVHAIISLDVLGDHAMSAISRARFVATSLSASVAMCAPARAQTTSGLRVGAAANDDFAEPYYARDLGFFRDAGLDVDLQTFSSGAAAADGVIGGSLDIAITTPLLLANGFLRGVPFAIVAAGPLATPQAATTLLVVAKDGPIHSAADLVGKTVGINVLHTVLQLSLDAYLEANNVAPSSVQTVEVTFPSEAPAIARGTIQAAVLVEPFLAEALQRGEIRELANPYRYIAPQFLVGAWFTSRRFASQHPDLVQRFVQVIYRTARWANANNAQSAAILAKYTRIPPQVIRTMTRATFAEHMDPADMQALLDVAHRDGLLAKPVAAADLIVTA